MNKIIHNDDQDQLLSSLGVLSTFFGPGEMVKSASMPFESTFSRAELDSFRPDKDHFMAHYITMGAQEAYGWNRNGDGFPNDALIEHHPTFEKYARYYREHANNDEKLAIGHVKAARYSPSMMRGEIVVWGDIKKAAKEYEMAKAGKAQSCSMSCSIPHDFCSCCKKASRTPREYCTHLKEKLLQYLPEYQKYAFMINKQPKFKDISAVEKPADRIAHFLEYMFGEGPEMAKAASSNRIITGAEWATFYGMPEDEDISRYFLCGQKGALLEKLAAEEAWLEKTLHNKEASSNMKLDFVRSSIPYLQDGDLADEDLEAIRYVRPGTLFSELSKRSAILPIRSFMAYISGQKLNELDPVLVKQACCCMPGMFQKLMAQGCGASEMLGMFDGSDSLSAACDSANGDIIQKIMDKADQKFGISVPQMQGRVVSMSANKCASELTTPKQTGEVGPEAELIAEMYALYKVSALADMQVNEDQFDEKKSVLCAASNFLVYA